MLKRYAATVSLLRSIIDIAIITLLWVAVYFIRFNLDIFGSGKGVPDFVMHLKLAAPIVVICYLGCLWSGLYKSKRVLSISRQFIDIVKAVVLGSLLILAFLYYIQDIPYSRKLLVLFMAMLCGGLFISHLTAIVILRGLRKKGYNLRHYAVIGSGRNGQRLVQDIEKCGWLGLKCKCFVDNNPERIGSELMGLPVYGPIEKLSEILNPRNIDEVYLTLSGQEAQAAYPFLEQLQLAGLTVRIIPDWGNLISLSNVSAVTIGSQVLFSAGESPLNSTNNIILKEVFDRLIALILLIILAVPFAVIAILIKLTSKGPVFYRQIRVGMDQREFEIIKFRTMMADAEKESGPQWAKPSDPRRTKFGTFLRRSSIDEIPPLINVLKGEMSLVGPRPERPCFVKQFSEEYKKYLFRHKLKAGMTGWAQVCGFRGDSSLKKRLQYDLYYIRNWSFGLDIKILLLTPVQIITGKNAY